MSLRIGFVTFSSDGHLNPSITLAMSLASRGHSVIFYCLSDGVEKLEQLGFSVRPYGVEQFPKSSILESYRALGKMSGMRAVRSTLDQFRLRAITGLQEFPALFRKDRLDGMIVDQVVPDGSAVALAENIPYVTVSNALPVNLSHEVPPVFSHGIPGRGLFPSLRHVFLNRLADLLAQPILNAINDFQEQRGLNPFFDIGQLRSPLAHLSQLPRSFDFPQQQLASQFHYVGPLHRLSSRRSVDFPWDRLNPDRPLVYVSMGTLQNQIPSVFRTIAQACQELPVQLVVSLGGGELESGTPKLAGDPIVVPYAPQLELLKRADLCVTHAGLNTALESLAHGVPMLAIPITNDQPGVAARIEWGGTGRRIRLPKLSVKRVRATIQDLLSNPGYCENAAHVQNDIDRQDGPETAAQIVEQAIQTAQPVLNREP